MPRIEVETGQLHTAGGRQVALAGQIAEMSGSVDAVGGSASGAAGAPDAAAAIADCCAAWSASLAMLADSVGGLGSTSAPPERPTPAPTRMPCPEGRSERLPAVLRRHHGARGRARRASSGARSSAAWRGSLVAVGSEVRGMPGTLATWSGPAALATRVRV